MVDRLNRCEQRCAPARVLLANRPVAGDYFCDLSFIICLRRMKQVVSNISALFAVRLETFDLISDRDEFDELEREKVSI